MKLGIFLGVFIVLYFLTCFNTALIFTSLVAILSSLSTPSTNVVLSYNLFKAATKIRPATRYKPYVSSIVYKYLREKLKSSPDKKADAIKLYHDMYLNRLDESAEHLVFLINENLHRLNISNTDGYQSDRIYDREFDRLEFRQAAMAYIESMYSPEHPLAIKNFSREIHHDFESVYELPPDWRRVLNKDNVKMVYMAAFDGEYSELNDMTGLMDLFDEFVKNQTDDVKANRDGMLKIFIYKFLKWLYMYNEDIHRLPTKAERKAKPNVRILKSNHPDAQRYPFNQEYASVLVPRIAPELPSDIQRVIAEEVQADTFGKHMYANYNN